MVVSPTGLIIRPKIATNESYKVNRDISPECSGGDDIQHQGQPAQAEGGDQNYIQSEWVLDQGIGRPIIIPYPDCIFIVSIVAVEDVCQEESVNNSPVN